MTSHAQIEKYLTSSNPQTRQNLAGNDTYWPSYEQFERGTLDEIHHVRAAWARRTAPSIVPTPDQINRGLNDHYWNVRMLWAERVDYTPTPEQVYAGLNDDHHFVRQTWAERKDIVMTPEQLFIGLNDEFQDVFCAISCRPESVLNETQYARLAALDETVFSSTNFTKEEAVRNVIVKSALDNEVIGQQSRKPRML